MDNKPYTIDVEKLSRVKIELNEVSNLVGKLLTVADASFTDKQQREGVKSLIKQIVWAWGKDWHLGATEENIQWMAENSEECSPPEESQIEHLD
jgi:hypothetical protein